MKEPTVSRCSFERTIRWTLTGRLAGASLLLLPLPAHASDPYGFGEAALVLFAYVGLFVLHVVGCIVAMIRARSWRPALVLPLSIAFSAALIFILVSFDPEIFPRVVALALLAGAPLLAIPLAILLYRDLFREQP